MSITKQCIECKQSKTIEVPAEQYRAWLNGALIQNAMPGLSPDDRELLISGVCGSCFDKLFAEDEK